MAFEFGRLWTEVTTGCGIVIFGGSAKLSERRRRDVALEERESPWPRERIHERARRSQFCPLLLLFFFSFLFKSLREPLEGLFARARSRRDPRDATRVAKGDALVTIP